MDHIDSGETEIVGKWVLKGSEIDGDEGCKRVEKLVGGYLQHVAFSPQFGAWETLFRDPTDGRYWERTYYEGHMHGGGPPSLRVLDKQTAEQKYGLSLP